MIPSFRKTTLIFLLLISSTVFATTRKVLFIGNSYTYTNNMPLMLQTMATNLGDTLIYDESDPGGYTFSAHCTNATTISKIFSRQWDVVVLQEQSQLPSFPPAEVDTEVYPYAHILDSMIHANDSCTQTMFLMTWGHANGDPMNCGFYPVICTYAGMQMRLRESYLQMTQDNQAVVAPVGSAFNIVMDSFSSIWLFSPDSSHPIIPGSYLETCVLYSSIFHKPTLNCTYTDGLSTTVAQTLQRVSDKVVMDSLYQWQHYGHYPAAGFGTSTTGLTTTFSSTSPYHGSSAWQFGDGGTDTATNPVHHYASATDFVVTHTITTNCFTETQTDTLHLGTTGIGNLGSGSTLKISNIGGGKIIFHTTDLTTGTLLDVYNISGQRVDSFNPNGKDIIQTYLPGIYFYQLYSESGARIGYGRVAVY